MSFELMQNPLVITVAAFLVGCVITSVSIRLREKKKAPERDPRDVRILSLEAEYRVAKTEVDKLKSDIASVESVLNEVAPGVEERDKVIAEQQATIDQLRKDLVSSVRKTRQLRAELAERATENVHAEAKIREALLPEYLAERLAEGV